MSRVVHFEIPADNPERAAAFYKQAFGWKIEKWPGPMEWQADHAEDANSHGRLFRLLPRHRRQSVRSNAV